MENGRDHSSLLANGTGLLNIFSRPSTARFFTKITNRASFACVLACGNLKIGLQKLFYTLTFSLPVNRSWRYFQSEKTIVGHDTRDWNASSSYGGYLTWPQPITHVRNNEITRDSTVSLLLLCKPINDRQRCNGVVSTDDDESAIPCAEHWTFS